jgi:hypothetical protein
VTLIVPNTRLIDEEGRATPAFLRWINSVSASGGAPTNAQYVTLSTNSLLSAERVLQGTSGNISLTDGGANGNATLNLVDTAVTPGTYGDSSNIPVITVDQKGRITAASEVEAPSGGGGGGWTLIERIVTSGSQTSVDFQDIPDDYQDLVIIGWGRSQDAAGAQNQYVRMNNDSTSGNYNAQAHQGTGSSTTSSIVAGAATGAWISAWNGTTGSSTNRSSVFQAIIPQYANTALSRSGISWSAVRHGAGSSQAIIHAHFYWDSTSAISRLTFSIGTTAGASAYMNGCVFSLFGVS